MAVKRVVLMRPGETDWNKLGRFQGWVAIPLNEHGRLQAKRLANYVRHIGLRALYTSDLRRAAETAAILEPRLHYAPTLEPRLRERNVGIWQGLTRDEIQAWYPDEYEHLVEDREDFRVPDGESRDDVRQRVVAAFNDILAQDKGETVGVISHTTTIHTLLNELIPGAHADTLSVSNTSVTTIVREDDRWKLVTSNDLMHLEGLETKISPEIGEEQ
ncbi:MAG: histidine phosphatase family protein [Anaerolineaceae bacterium]|nr:histidine phosphatase family protein [Anaerolineaceae bacterium]